MATKREILTYGRKFIEEYDNDSNLLLIGGKKIYDGDKPATPPKPEKKYKPGERLEKLAKSTKIKSMPIDHAAAYLAKLSL